MMNMRKLRGRKVRLLTAMALGGGMAFASCSAVDIRHNLVAGTQSFVQDYTADLWAALFPPADEIVNLGD